MFVCFKIFLMKSKISCVVSLIVILISPNFTEQNQTYNRNIRFVLDGKRKCAAGLVVVRQFNQTILDQDEQQRSLEVIFVLKQEKDVRLKNGEQPTPFLVLKLINSLKKIKNKFYQSNFLCLLCFAELNTADENFCDREETGKRHPCP